MVKSGPVHSHPKVFMLEQFLSCQVHPRRDSHPQYYVCYERKLLKNAKKSSKGVDKIKKRFIIDLWGKVGDNG
jgi:hypothetical protein